MTESYDRIRRCLRAGDLTTLFIEELGWDHHSAILTLPVQAQTFTLHAVAEKRGLTVLQCAAPPGEAIPPYPVRGEIERQVAQHYFEHLIIFTTADQTEQVWQWVKRELGKPLARREHHYQRDQSGDALIQKLQAIAFTLEQEAGLTLTDVVAGTRVAFDVERVTKRFYDRFQKEHSAFLAFLKGIPDTEMQHWYASVMLNRLMFIYFIQRKGFLDGDSSYLSTKLTQMQQQGDDRYYRDFLCPLFFEGFARRPAERSPEINALLGTVPYLNGGLFLRHPIEERHGAQIAIPDRAFERLFGFFDQYQWHLDDRPLRDDNEINPDVLGYIFEKYINQKQMGAYYTREDITGYISQNTVLPCLFDTARQQCRVAFAGEQSIWRLLRDDPDRYIYPAVRHGSEHALPPEIAAGIDDVTQRTQWNKPAPQEYALPTEIWREVVARRRRYAEVRAKLAAGDICDINDLVTYNLDMRQFAQDVIQQCEGPELLRAFYRAIEQVTVLDPTCGSGAFLFAALNILEPLYDACLERMQGFLDDLARAEDTPHPQKMRDFRETLERVGQHPNRHYFIFKSIIVNNLFGVDIMEEAVEICKLRLFLKLVAQIERAEQIEPLPDIDFNIRAGNTLVGFATYAEVQQAITNPQGNAPKLLLTPEEEASLAAIETQAQDVDRLFQTFRQQQTTLGGAVTPEDKHELRHRLDALNDELNHYLAAEYGVKLKQDGAYAHWRATHQPFHWFVEFYGIMQQGGFDVIIGNPPYIGYSKVRHHYTVRGYVTEPCGNLYALTVERAPALLRQEGRCGMIVPIASVSTDSMQALQNLYQSFVQWHSHYAVRPGKLFIGVDMNLTISLFYKTNERKNSCGTGYRRWSSGTTGDRRHIFETLSYVSEPCFTNHVNPHPKLGSSIEKQVLCRMLDHGRKLRAYTTPVGVTLYYHSGGRYWRKALLSKLSSHYKPVTIQSALAPIVLALLNSQLFYWYWISNSNCMDVVSREVLDLPVFALDTVDPRPFYKLQEELLIAYNTSSTTRVRRGKHIQVEEINFDVHKAKPIIDEIDRALAQHYGFTPEELDFIINYDIKYRMGRDGGAEG